MIEPKGKFSLYSFEPSSNLYVVVLRYLSKEVKPKKEALFEFWRYIGAI